MISRTVLVAAEPFGPELDATRVASAIGQGLTAGDSSLTVDACPIEPPHTGEQDAFRQPSRRASDEARGGQAPPSASNPRTLLDALGFDARMRAARAVVIAAERLDHETLLHGGPAFEIATRARQAGVPCYAVLGCDALDAFEARILDLQTVIEASGSRGLAAAGRKLAAML